MAGRLWREAASLIIISPIRCSATSTIDKVQKFKQDYNVLFVKRSNKSVFLPNAFVFPGGVVEPSDFSKPWLDIFRQHGYSEQDVQALRNDTPLPEMYTNKPSDYILPELGFRIGAIRETFEETGLLLAHNCRESPLSLDQLIKWRNIVHNDASQFIKLFEETGGCPAVWDLHEWSGWLTPAHVRIRRFNTVFFITFQDALHIPAIDNKEISAVQMSSPNDIARAFRSGDLVLPPPQFYEISRFLNFQRYEDFKNFAEIRGKKGLDIIFGVFADTSVGRFQFLPGDDLYPEKPDFSGKHGLMQLSSSNEELLKSSKHLHRLQFISDINDYYIFMNVVPKFGQVKPMKFEINEQSNM